MNHAESVVMRGDDTNEAWVHVLGMLGSPGWVGCILWRG